MAAIRLAFLSYAAMVMLVTTAPTSYWLLLLGACWYGCRKQGKTLGQAIREYGAKEGAGRRAMARERGLREW